MAEFSSMGSPFFSFNDQNQHFVHTPTDPNINHFGYGYNPNLCNVEETLSQINILSEDDPKVAATDSNPSSSGEMVQDNGNSGNNGGGTTDAAPQANPQFQSHGPYYYPLDTRTIVELPVWPGAVLPFHCTNCQVLREIIHTNGADFKRLEIHGRVGFIAHAIHNHKFAVPSSNGRREAHSVIDFSQRGIEEIKGFLTEYCQSQNVQGYVVVADPFSSYYEALTTGLEWTEDFNDEDPEPNPSVPEASEQNLITAGGKSDNVESLTGADMERNARTSLSEKRERTARLRLVDLADYFHLPIEEAARQLDLCITVVKKICRKDGLARWPYRKVTALVKQRKNLVADDEGAKARTQAEIDRFKEEIVHHCGGVRPTSLDFECQFEC